MWEATAKAGVKLVPTITPGSDSRPRQEYPLPWERRRLLDAVPSGSGAMILLEDLELSLQLRK